MRHIKRSRLNCRGAFTCPIVLFFLTAVYKLFAATANLPSASEVSSLQDLPGLELHDVHSYRTFIYGKEAMCRHSHRHEVLSHFVTEFRIPQNSTCALVGNSGVLRESNFGESIDKHDVVLRFALPELDGRDTGLKTTILSLNPSLLFTSLQETTRILNQLKPTLVLASCRFPVCYESLVNYVKEWSSLLPDGLQISVPNCDYLTAVRYFLDRQLGFVWPDKRKPTSGILLLPYLLKTCASVSVYGIWPFRSDCFNQTTPYHYWDRESKDWFSLAHSTTFDMFAFMNFERNYKQKLALVMTEGTKCVKSDFIHALMKHHLDATSEESRT